MAGFTKKTLKEIKNSIVNDFETRINAKTPVLLKSVIDSLAWSVAGVAAPFYNQLNWLYLQLFVQSCCLTVLKLWGALVSVFYKDGTNCVIQAVIDNVTASVIHSGTLWKSLDNGVVYKSVSSVTPVNGSITVTLEAQTSGPDGNINPEQILHITNPLEGVPDTATVETVLVTGSSAEKIEAYRRRVLLKYQQKPQGGALPDFVSWALEVEGIVDALPYLFTTGVITLYLVGEGSGRSRTPSGNVVPNPFPEWENGQMKPLAGSGLFLQVAQSINGTDANLNKRRPVNTSVKLEAPIYEGYKVFITGLEPNTNAICKEIKDAIIAHLDERRPHIPAINYTKQNATINANYINSLVQNVVNNYNGSFNSFVLKNSDDETINETTLSTGALACLDKLMINEADIPL